MFTQCPECKTIFELGIDDLKAAEGRVCCGECDKIFNALASLTDLPPGAQEELRALADAAALADDMADDTADDAADGHMASGDLFAQEPDEDADEDEKSDDSHWDPDEEGLAEDDVASLERKRWEQKLAELGLDGTENADYEAAARPADDVPDETTDPSTDEETLAELVQDADWLVADRLPRANWQWVVAAAVAGVLLVVQSVHYWRADLGEVPVIGSWLRPFYASVGAPLPENWDVSAYNVAKDTISDHPEVAGALLVSASVMNDGEQAQPFPLLKITLLDRWGEPIGERFFAPAEYLANMQEAENPIQPGQVAPASVLIMDPGAGAVSYGIDACLRDNNNRLRCAHGRDY